MATRNLEILKLFLLFPDKEFCVKDISKSLNISLATSYWIVKDLLFQGFVTCSRGTPAKYKLDFNLLNVSSMLEKGQNTFKVELSLKEVGGCNNQNV